MQLAGALPRTVRAGGDQRREIPIEHSLEIRTKIERLGFWAGIKYENAIFCTLSPGVLTLLSLSLLRHRARDRWTSRRCGRKGLAEIGNSASRAAVWPTAASCSARGATGCLSTSWRVIGHLGVGETTVAAGPPTPVDYRAVDGKHVYEIADWVRAAAIPSLASSAPGCKNCRRPVAATAEAASRTGHRRGSACCYTRKPFRRISSRCWARSGPCAKLITSTACKSTAAKVHSWPSTL